MQNDVSVRLQPYWVDASFGKLTPYENTYPAKVDMSHWSFSELFGLVFQVVTEEEIPLLTQSVVGVNFTEVSQLTPLYGRLIPSVESKKVLSFSQIREPIEDAQNAKTEGSGTEPAIAKPPIA